MRTALEVSKSESPLGRWRAGEHGVNNVGCFLVRTLLFTNDSLGKIGRNKDDKIIITTTTTTRANIRWWWWNAKYYKIWISSKKYVGNFKNFNFQTCTLKSAYSFTSCPLPTSPKCFDVSIVCPKLERNKLHVLLFTFDQSPLYRARSLALCWVYENSFRFCSSKFG